MADKGKQNLRYAKTCRKLNKERCKGLTDEQKKYIKSKEAYEQSEKAMNDFWKTALRTDSGAVGWESMTDSQLDYFGEINKIHERNIKRISKLEESGIGVEYTLNLFRELNCNSVCF